MSSPKTLQNVNDLAMLLYSLGELEGAHTYLSRELAIRQRCQDPDDPALALCHNDLGMLLCQMGDLELATTHLQQALAIMENFPERFLHHRTAQILNNLGMALWQRADLTNALFYLRRSLTTYQLTLGRHHPETRAARQDMERLKKLQLTT